MIAIIVLNYKTPKETKSCVKSIINQTKDCEYKIFVVDNMSPDKSYDILLKEFKNLKNVEMLQTGKNQGYSAGNNYVCKKISVDQFESTTCC